jgi:hypothetical protein
MAAPTSVDRRTMDRTPWYRYRHAVRLHRREMRLVCRRISDAFTPAMHGAAAAFRDLYRVMEPAMLACERQRLIETLREVRDVTSQS